MSGSHRDLDHLALRAYHLGRDPMAWAEFVTKTAIDTHLTVLAARITNPAAYPGYIFALTTDVLTRRVLGALLDAGWTCPDAAEVLEGYEPPQLPPEAKAAIDFLCTLPDQGAQAQQQAADELGNVDTCALLIRAAEIARGEAS